MLRHRPRSEIHRPADLSRARASPVPPTRGRAADKVSRQFHGRTVIDYGVVWAAPDWPARRGKARRGNPRKVPEPRQQRGPVQRGSWRCHELRQPAHRAAPLPHQDPGADPGMGAGVGSWQAGSGSWPVPWRLCTVGPEVTSPSFLGDSGTHVLRKKVTASRGGGWPGTTFSSAPFPRTVSSLAPLPGLPPLSEPSPSRTAPAARPCFPAQDAAPP